MFYSIDSLVPDTLNDSAIFAPQLLLCAGMICMLALRLFDIFRRLHMGVVALGFTAGALALAVFEWPGLTGFASSTTSTGRSLFSHLLVDDGLSEYLNVFLLSTSLLTICLTMLTGIPDREDSADFYCLLLGATLGMMLMAASQHLLMIYLAVEMASVPSYALAGFLKGRRLSGEAALKYVVYGGGASGIMLYGISLLAGTFGTGYLPDLAAGLATSLGHSGINGMDPILVLGTLFLLIGIAFKLAAVPFHFWCPDVFEGASAEVAGFLSVASKAAALALLARIGLTLTGHDQQVSEHTNLDWESCRRLLIPAIAACAALTMTFGNLAAFRQTNLKRLLAYSTIAQAGTMLMGLAPLNAEGTAAVLFYLPAYLFMNLGAFAVVAFLRNRLGSEDLGQCRGLVRRSPWMVVTLAIFLLSLLGVPPLVGFLAKFQVFSAVYHAGQTTSPASIRPVLFALLVIGCLNTVISAFYYLKILKVMILDPSLEDVEGSAPVRLREPFAARAYATVLAVALVLLGVAPNDLAESSETAVQRFRTPEKLTKVSDTNTKDPG